MNNIYKYLMIFLCIFTFSGCNLNTIESQKTQSLVSNSFTLDEKSENLYSNASTLYQNGKSKEALEAVNKAIEFNKNNYKALSLKGLLLSFDNNPSDGIKLINEALKINPDYTQGFYEMAIALKLNRQYNESIVFFQKVLEKDSKNTWSYYGISTNYADMNDKENSLLYLKKAIDLGGASVKEAAYNQDHFKKFHSDPYFESLVAN